MYFGSNVILVLCLFGVISFLYQKFDIFFYPLLLYTGWAYVQHTYCSDKNEKHETAVKEKKKEAGQLPQQQQQQQPKKKKQNNQWQKGKQSFTHEWLMTSLKGHSGTILDMDFSANGKYLATCGDDRTIFIWMTKDWKEKTHQNIRYNVAYDHASIIKWSPDSKAFVYNRATDNQLDVCKILKKPDGKTVNVSKSTTYSKGHKDDILNVGISSNGKFMMSCTSGTEIAIWNLKGSELFRFDSYLINNFSVKISPCGRFIAASGFAPDVKFWEVTFTKNGEFKQANPVFQLKGHESGVYDFSFNVDSTQVATISKHGCWRLFNIKVEYNQGEEPKLIKTGKIKTEDGAKGMIALSPDGQTIAIAFKDVLTLVNVITGEIDKTISNIYTGGIQKVMFDSGGDYVVICGDRHVHVFHNVTGKRASIASSNEKLATSGLSSLTKQRLQETIKSSKDFLDSMKENY